MTGLASRVSSRAARVALLVAPIALALTSVELALLAERPTTQVVLGALTLVLGTSGLLALASCAPRAPRRIEPLLLALPVAVALPSLDVATARATELLPALNAVGVPVIATLAAAVIGVAGWRILRSRLGSLGRLRHLLVATLAVTTAVALLAPLEEARDVAPRVAALLAVVVFVAAAAWHRRSGLAWLGAILSAGAAHLVPTAYPTVRTAAGISALTWATVGALRVFAHWVDGADARRSRGALAVAGVSMALLVMSERTLAPVAGRFGTAARGGLAASLVRTTRSVTDLDRDGFGQAFGQHDCSPFDPAVHPGRHEVPGNGTDENCLAGAAPGDPVAWIRDQEAVHARPPARRGDVLVLSVDALRYDHASDPSLPNVRRLAAEGLEFERAYTTSTLTAQALPGLVAGHLPTWRTYTFAHPFCPVPDRPVEGLGTALGGAGYDTAFVGGFDRPDNPIFTARESFPGFRTLVHTPYLATPAETVAAAEETFARMDATRPRLLWVHLMWLHHQPDREAYAEGVRAVDEALGALRSGIGRSALTVFTADHGEAFGDHHFRGHAQSLYVETTHVPLIVGWSGGPIGKVATVTSVRALAPTLVAMADPARAPPGLGPYLCTDTSACRDMPAPMALELQARHLHGLVVGRHHVIRDILSGDLLGFDLLSDPEELRPLRPPPPVAADALIAWEETAFGADGDACAWPYAPAP